MRTFNSSFVFRRPELKFAFSPFTAILDLVSSFVAALLPQSEASRPTLGFTMDKPKLSSLEEDTALLKSKKFSNGEWPNLLISLRSMP